VLRRISVQAGDCKRVVAHGTSNGGPTAEST
jgi:hypothetical protein